MLLGLVKSILAITITNSHQKSTFLSLGNFTVSAHFWGGGLPSVITRKIPVFGFDHFRFRFAVFCIFLDLRASEKKCQSSGPKRPPRWGYLVSQGILGHVGYQKNRLGEHFEPVEKKIWFLTFWPHFWGPQMPPKCPQSVQRLEKKFWQNFFCLERVSDHSESI